jgi:biopolymer transport protein ExbD
MDFRKRYNREQVGFQMAPMVDIMFLLLILFMAANIFAQWETKMGITVPTADSGVKGVRQPGEVIVNIDENGLIYVNSVEMTPDRLKQLLAQVADAFRDQPVIIRADRNTKHEDVIQVLDICREVDIWNVAFASLPPKDAPN